jgi:hypothetical protein
MDTDGTAGIADAIIIQPFHDRAIFFKIESIKLILVIISIFWGDCLDEIDVLIRVKRG